MQTRFVQFPASCCRLRRIVKRGAGLFRGLPTILMAALLAVVLGAGSAAARDAGAAAGKEWFTLPHLPHLTEAQLAAAAGIGLAAGVTAVIAARNAVAGFGLGAVVALYVAHLAVEAALVGGAYYFWQTDKNPRDQPSHSLKLRIATGSIRV